MVKIIIMIMYIISHKNPFAITWLYNCTVIQLYEMVQTDFLT